MVVFSWCENAKSNMVRLYKDYFIAPKILYSLQGIALYSCYGLRPLLFEDRFKIGLIDYGLISGILSLFTFILSPVWSFLADSFHLHKLLLIISVALSPSLFLLLLIPARSMFIFIPIWYSYMIMTINYVFLMDSMVVKMLMRSKNAGKELYGRQRMMATLFGSLTTTIVGFLVDNYGYDSVFIAVGSSSFLLLICICLYFPSDSSRKLLTAPQHKNMQDAEKKTPIIPQTMSQSESQTKACVDFIDDDRSLTPQAKEFLITEACEEIAPPLAILELSHANEQEQQDYGEGMMTSKEEMDRKSPVKILLTNPSFVFFLVIVFLIGVVRSMMTYYQAVYVNKSLKLNRSLIGVFSFFGIALELAILFFGKYFLRKFSIFWLVAFSIMGNVFKMWGFYFTPIDEEYLWLLLIFELGKGANFGFLHIAGVQLCNTIAPKGLETTAQTIYSNVFGGLPAVISALTGGYIIHYLGMKMLFLGCAVLSFLSLFLYLVKGYYDHRRQAPPKGK